MQSKPKSNSVITYEPLYDNGVCVGIRFRVRGQDKPLDMDMRKLHPTIWDRAAMHGMTQRVSDAAAMSRNPETGASATPQEKYDAMARLVAHYESGTDQWSVVRERGEGPRRGLIIIRALADVMKIASFEVPDKIKALAVKRGETARKVYATFRTQPGKVRDRYEELRDAEAAKSGIAGNDLLNEIE